MQHKSDAELIAAADLLIAKPVDSWVTPDVVEAVDLLIILSNQNVDDAAYGRFPALEAAIANAPVTSANAALAKLLWIDKQPEPEERQDWEPAAFESIRAFLSNKAYFPPEIGSDSAPITPVNPWAETMAGYIDAPPLWWNDDRLSDAVLTEATCREWVNAKCEVEPPPANEEIDALAQPLCDLQSAIMAAPVEGVIGARAKLRLLSTENWDARLRTDFDVCMQSILDGLNAVLGDVDNPSETPLQEAA